MPNPQQPELARSRKTGNLTDAGIPSAIEVQPDLRGDGPVGPVPEENLPGHHPAVDQDKPPIERFLARARTAGSRLRPSGRDDRGPDAPGGAQDESRPNGEHPLVRLAGLGPRAASNLLQKLRNRL